MSNDAEIPEEQAQLPNGGGTGITTVSARFSTLGSTPMYVGVPFTVQGISGSNPEGEVSSVTLLVDGTPVPVVNDSGDWSSWHAQVTPASTGSHTFSVRASSTTLNKSGTSLLNLIANPVLTGVSPTPANGIITTALLSFSVGVAIGTTAFGITASGWRYQLGGGAWAPPSAVAQPSTMTWLLTISVPATAVGLGGTSYPLLIQATTPQNLIATLALTVHAVDQIAPSIMSLTAPTEAVAGTSPVVTIQASDRLPGAVFSGIAPAGVSVSLDGQGCAVTQTVAGDPGTWQATLPAITHALHNLAVIVADAAGNTIAASRTFTVALSSWTRLEPVPRDNTLMEGLQAKVADPFWLLARQAAFGEFIGQDSASPVSFRLRARTSSLTRFRPARQAGSGPGELLSGAGAGGIGPLEMLAEAEAEPAPGGAVRPLFAAQAGLHYRRLLARTAGIGDLTTYEQGLLSAYPVPPPQSEPGAGVPPAPDPGDAALAPYAGRVPDGARLYADLAAALRPVGGQGELPVSPALGGASAAMVQAVALTWLSWYDAVSGQELGQRDTWIPERTEYAFGVAAPGPGAETVLAASELGTGELDWHDFDLLASGLVAPASPSVSLGAVPADLPGGDIPLVIAGLPSPVTFRGMPNRRWWDFEDASIDFGAITAPVESVTTSVIVEFAMSYGNDHFIVPVPLAAGSVLRVDSLAVTDTYGEVLIVSPVSTVDSATGPFRLFEHSVPAPASVRDPLFVLFPTVGEVSYGPALEEVHFVRDAATEIVWAIEQTALGPVGRPVDRTADALAHFAPLTATPNDGSGPPSRAYVLRTDVEANWFPFLLTYPPLPATGPPLATMLAMADVPALAAHQLTPLPWGRILAPFAPTVPGTGGTSQPGILLPLEEVTRAGVQVVRAWRYARWADGRHLSWVGRRVRPGRGPGASGLSFDLTI